MTAPPSATVERQDVIAALKVSAANMLMGRKLKLRAIALLEAESALPRAPEVQRLAAHLVRLANQDYDSGYTAESYAKYALDPTFQPEPATTDYPVAESQALAAPPVDGAWVPIDEHARQSGRLLVGWYPDGELGSHVELGIFKTGNGWCNTYGHPFNGEPDVYMPLPALARPAAED